MIKYPINGQWTQTNKNNKTGSIWYSKNINLDKTGYLKLSPRSVNLYDDTESTTNIGDADFDYPVAFGRYGAGAFRLATTDEPFNIDINNTTKTIAEDNASNSPNLTVYSHGVWWQNAFLESTSQNIRSNTAGTWSGDLITNFTNSTSRHYLAVFKNKKSLCASDGNMVKLYDTSYALTTTLTIPSDFEIIGLAYNNYTLGIITRGQNQESYFFTWDGSSTEADTGVGIGCYTAVCVFPYKSSFVVLDSLGRLLYWNGGGFQELAHFPFYLDEHRWGDLINILSYGDNIVVDGDIIIINIGFDLDSLGSKSEEYLVANPSGVWCYDPEVGLYHRTSPSISRCYVHTITQANVDTSTNIFTTTATIPATGNVATLTSGTVGGLSVGTVYYIIKLSSTTFALAESKDLSEAGVKIDITSANTNQYFWMYDLKDYGTTYTLEAGAVALYDKSNNVYRDYIFGGQYLSTSLVSGKYLCSNVPYLENRGYVVLSRIFLDNVIDNTQRLYIKHEPLKAGDAIIIKTKRKQVLGLPTTSPNNATTDELIFIGANEAYTTTDLSEAKTLFDSGNDLECEFIAGVGAGQMVKISTITETSGTYTMSFEENILGATAGLKSYFVIDNWVKKGEVNYDNQDNGVYSYLIDEKSTSLFIKIELRGYNTTIEDLQIINTTHKPSK